MSCGVAYLDHSNRAAGDGGLSAGSRTGAAPASLRQDRRQRLNAGRQRVAVLSDRAFQLRREGELFFVGKVKVHDPQMGPLTFAAESAAGADGNRVRLAGLPSPVINHIRASSWGALYKGQSKMKVFNHPHATKVILSTRIKWPNPGVVERVLVLEANIPLSEKIAGYDPAKVGSLIDFACATMEELQTEKAEIFPLTEPDVGYIVSRDSTPSPRPAGP
jgi:hypothetical protein